MADDPANKGGDPMDEPPPGGFKPRSLAQLRSHQCKWPVIEDHTSIGHFLFCGLPTNGELPYCDHHHRMATSKQTKGGFVRPRPAPR